MYMGDVQHLLCVFTHLVFTVVMLPSLEVLAVAYLKKKKSKNIYIYILSVCECVSHKCVRTPTNTLGDRYKVP